MNLRLWQRAALRAVSAAWASGQRTALVVAPTGVGKSLLFADVLRRRKAAGRKRGLVLAPWIELVNQAMVDLTKSGLTSEAEQGDRMASIFPSLFGGSDVVVGCLPTFASQRRGSRWPQDAFETVVVDEAHSSEEAAQEVLGRFPGAFVLALTATPNEDTVRVYGKPVYEYTIEAAIRDGALVPPVTRLIPPHEMSLTTVRKAGRDLDPDELGRELTSTEQTIACHLGAALEHAGDRQTIAYLPTRASADAYRHVMGRLIGFDRVDYIDGETPEEARQRVLGAYREGSIRWLFNVGVLTTGVNLPMCSAIAMLRPTLSTQLFRQCVGRGLRTNPGKADCMVILLDPNTADLSLCSTVDLFVDDCPHDIRQRATRAIASGEDASRVVSTAKERAAERRKRQERDNDSRIQVIVESKARVVDLFKTADLPQDPSLAKGSRITEAQAQALRKAYGRPDLTVRDLSQAQYRQLMAPVEDRRKRGLCTLPMSRVLMRNGLPGDMPFAEARLVLDALFAERRARQGGER